MKRILNVLLIVCMLVSFAKAVSFANHMVLGRARFYVLFGLIDAIILLTRREKSWS